MPRNLQQLRIFLASPSDVQAERARVEKVVREMNFTLSNQGLQLELLRWETHTFPDFGEYPQTVIQDQIGSDYDIFVGVLWSRIGTPTPRFPSGTLEEFETTAYQKWQAAPHDVTLMIYFKDEPISPSRMDLTQLSQLQTFKAKLPAAGGLYRTFQTVDDFETQIRLHLIRVVQVWRDRVTPNALVPSSAAGSTMPSGSPDSDPGSTAIADDEGDLGFLDYLDLVSEAGTRHGAVLERMTAAMEEIGKRAQERTIEVESLKSSPNPSAAREIFDQSARDLNEFSASTQGEIPQLAQAHADMLKYLVQGTTLSLEMNAESREHAAEALNQLDNFTEIIRSTRARMVEFQATISDLPRMTVKFNRAKRRALPTLEALDTVFGEAIDRNTKVRQEISDLLQRLLGAARKALNSPEGSPIGT